MQAYAVKLAVIFVPLPPPLGVIIEKGAPLGSGLRLETEHVYHKMESQ